VQVEVHHVKAEVAGADDAEQALRFAPSPYIKPPQSLTIFTLLRCFIEHAEVLGW
jgi:hypothetical protein